MCANMVPFLNRSVEGLDLYYACKAEVEFMNSTYGMHYDIPEHSPVYSNFAMQVQSGYNQFTGSYYIDGFHMGFQNDDVAVLPVLPGSKIFLSEAQVYYNSRNSRGQEKALPYWVTSFFEEHGHFDLDIWLDCQRPGLIDVSIRELATRFVCVVGMDNYYDDLGRVVASKWHLKEFDDWKWAEKYIDTGDESHCFDTEYDYQGNIFECYESRCYRRSFMPKRNFARVQHVYGLENKTYSFMYSQKPPTGFFGTRASSGKKKKGVAL